VKKTKIRDTEHGTYDGWTADQLRKRLVEKGLKKGGVIADLKERLKACDESEKIVQMEKDLISQRPPCENCSDMEEVLVIGPAYYECETCDNQKLCKSCYDAHKKTKVTRYHDILPLGCFRKEPLQKLAETDCNLQLIEKSFSILDLSNEEHIESSENNNNASDTNSDLQVLHIGEESANISKNKTVTNSPNCIVCKAYLVGSHKCCLCGGNVHVFCGQGIGEEGFGQLVQCFNCIKPSAPPSLSDLLAQYFTENNLPFKLRSRNRSDGNCWYEAIVDQVVLHGIEDMPVTHDTMRKAVCKALLTLPQNKSWIKHLFGGKKKNFVDFVQKHRRSGEWTDDKGLICQATALMLKRNIHIVGTANKGQSVSYTKLDSVAEADNFKPLNVGYYQDQHYHSIEKVDVSMEDNTKTVDIDAIVSQKIATDNMKDNQCIPIKSSSAIIQTDAPSVIHRKHPRCSISQKDVNDENNAQDMAIEVESPIIIPRIKLAERMKRLKNRSKNVAERMLTNNDSKLTSGESIEVDNTESLEETAHHSFNVAEIILTNCDTNNVSKLTSEKCIESVDETDDQSFYVAERILTNCDNNDVSKLTHTVTTGESIEADTPEDSSVETAGASTENYSNKENPIDDYNKDSTQTSADKTGEDPGNEECENDTADVNDNTDKKERYRKKGSLIVPDFFKQETVAESGGSWTKSRNGGDIYCHSGHGYHVNKGHVTARGEQVLYLTCINTMKGCKGRKLGKNKITDGKLFDPNHENHICEPDPIINELLEAANKVRLEALQTYKQPATIVSEVLSKMSDEARAWTEGPIRWTKMIHYHRQKVRGSMAKSISSFELPLD